MKHAAETERLFLKVTDETPDENFTLSTLARISAVLGVPLISVAK